MICTANQMPLGWSDREGDGCDL